METCKVNSVGESMKKTALCIILKMADSILSTAEDTMMINNLLGMIAPKLHPEFRGFFGDSKTVQMRFHCSSTLSFL